MAKKTPRNKRGSALTQWQILVSKHGMTKAKKLYSGYRQRKGKMYYKGDLTRKWSRSGGMTQKGVNTGDAWHIERGLTGGGKVAAKYFPFGSATGINKEEKWETKKGRADKRV